MSINEEQLAFYFEIGLTMTQWAGVERALFYVAIACVGHSKWTALSHGFYKIENFRSKLAFVDGLVSQKVASLSVQKQWSRLERRAGDAAGDRNQLAHRPVMGFPAERPGARFVLLARFSKSETQPQRSGLAPRDALGVFDVADLRGRLFTLMIELENFAALIRKARKPFPASFTRSRPPAKPETLLETLRTLGPKS